jgi:hypothetical protein
MGNAVIINKNDLSAPGMFPGLRVAMGEIKIMKNKGVLTH